MPASVITVGQGGQYSTIQQGIEAAEQSGIQDIVVSAGTYTENDTLSGTAANGITIEAASGAAVTLNGSINISGVSGVTIAGLTFQGDGTNVAVSATGSDRLTVTGNSFEGTSEAVLFDGTTNSTISSNHISDTTLSAIEEKNGSDYDTITNNSINGVTGDPNSPTKGSIWLHGATNGEISHNQISNVNNAGINLSDFDVNDTLTQNNNTVIEYNSLNNVVADTTDNGAIYVLGRSQNPQTGIIIRNNYIGAVGSTTIANPHAVGIYLDDNASGVTVSQNIVQASPGLTDPFEIHGGSNNTISGNIFDLGAGSPDFGLVQSDPSDQQPTAPFTQLTNNVISGNIFTTESQSPRNPAFSDLSGGQGSTSIKGNDFWSFSGAPLNVEGQGAGGDSAPVFSQPANQPAQTLADYGRYDPPNFSFTPIDTASIGVESNETDNALCYCPGTLIATPGGEVPIETLRRGDVVLLHDGSPEPIRWIGRRSYDGRFVRGNHLMLPVTIRADALAAGMPHTDLVVSPGHGVWVDQQLIPAWRLINGASITQATTVPGVSYIHLELARHALLRANGAVAESFVEVEGLRAQFQNAAEYRALFGDAPGPAPFQDRLESGFELQRIQERLAERAGVYPLIEPVGALRGVIDVPGPHRVCGWAQDVDSPEEPVVLELSVGPAWACRVLSNGWRADLRRAGLGSGCHAFDLWVPAGVSGRVAVRRVSDGAPLPEAATPTSSAWRRSASAGSRG